MGDLAALDRSHLRRENRHHRDRFAIERDELNFVPFSVAMHQYDRADITGPQIMLWNVTR